MKSSRFQIFLALACVVHGLLVVAQEPQGSAKSHPAFRGVVKTDIFVERPNNAIAPIAVFYETERTTFPMAHTYKPPPLELLKLVASEGKDLRDRLELVVASAKNGFIDDVNGKPGHRYRIIIAYPHTDTNDIEYKGVVRFSSGELRPSAKLSRSSARRLKKNSGRASPLEKSA